MTIRLLRRVARTTAVRLRDETGMALVIALGVSLVLAIMGTAIVIYSVGNEHHASRSRADLKAYTLAQGGIDSAAAQLAQAPGTSGGAPGSVTDPNFFTTLCATPSNCQTTTNGGTVDWSGGTLEHVVLGSPPATVDRYTWHLRARATVPNPASPGSTVSRTVTADVKLVPQTTQDLNADAWKYVYSRKTGTPGGCDETTYNNITFRSPMYVAGNFCVVNNSSVVGPANPATDPPVEVIVKGITYIQANRSYVGRNWGGSRTIQPVTRAWFDGGCSYLGGPVKATCGSTENTYVLPPPSPYDTSHQGGPTIPAPVAAFDAWYEEASPGPRQPCDPSISSTNPSGNPLPSFDTYTNPGPPLDVYSATHDGLAPLWNLTPSSYDYVCKTATGEISWTRGSPGQLRIAGTIFYDGPAQIDGMGAVQYSGLGSLYLGGSFYLHQSQLCGNLSGSNCNFAGWDFTNNLLVIVAEHLTTAPASVPAGIGIFLDQAQFQGALYSRTSIQISQSANAQGPMVADQEVIRNNSDTQDFSQFLKVPFGTPGNRTTVWKITTPRFYNG